VRPEINDDGETGRFERSGTSAADARDMGDGAGFFKQASGSEVCEPCNFGLRVGTEVPYINHPDDHNLTLTSTWCIWPPVGENIQTNIGEVFEITMGGTVRVKFPVEVTVAAGAFIVGVQYRITTTGSTTGEQWNTIAGTTDIPSGMGRKALLSDQHLRTWEELRRKQNKRPYAIGDIFIAIKTGTGTGTATANGDLVYEGNVTDWMKYIGKSPDEPWPIVLQAESQAINPMASAASETTTAKKRVVLIDYGSSIVSNEFPPNIVTTGIFTPPWYYSMQYDYAYGTNEYKMDYYKSFDAWQVVQLLYHITFGDIMCTAFSGGIPDRSKDPSALLRSSVAELGSYEGKFPEPEPETEGQTEARVAQENKLEGTRRIARRSVDSPPPSAADRARANPRWVPDSEVTKCAICENNFGFTIRRSHCRHCGRVVCNDCSGKTVPLASTSSWRETDMTVPKNVTDSGRICDNCVYKYENPSGDTTARVSSHDTYTGKIIPKKDVILGIKDTFFSLGELPNSDDIRDWIRNIEGTRGTRRAGENMDKVIQVIFPQVTDDRKGFLRIFLDKSWLLPFAYQYTVVEILQERQTNPEGDQLSEMDTSADEQDYEYLVRWKDNAKNSWEKKDDLVDVQLSKYGDSGAPLLAKFISEKKEGETLSPSSLEKTEAGREFHNMHDACTEFKKHFDAIWSDLVEHCWNLGASEAAAEAAEAAAEGAVGSEPEAAEAAGREPEAEPEGAVGREPEAEGAAEA